MTREELIERIKTTDCAVVAAQYRPGSSMPFVAVTRGRPEIIATLLSETLHAHTVNSVLTSAHRDAAGENGAATMYARLFEDAAKVIMSSIDLRLAQMSALPEATPLAALYELFGTEDSDFNYMIAAPIDNGLMQAIYRAPRAPLLDMMTEAIWQTAISHVDAQDLSGAVKYAERMLVIMRSYSDARYLRTMEFDRQRKLPKMANTDADTATADPAPDSADDNA